MAATTDTSDQGDSVCFARAAVPDLRFGPPLVGTIIPRAFGTVNVIAVGDGTSDVESQAETDTGLRYEDARYRFAAVIVPDGDDYTTRSNFDGARTIFCMEQYRTSAEYTRRTSEIDVMSGV